MTETTETPQLPKQRFRTTFEPLLQRYWLVIAQVVMVAFSLVALATVSAVTSLVVVGGALAGLVLLSLGLFVGMKVGSAQSYDDAQAALDEKMAEIVQVAITSQQDRIQMLTALVDLYANTHPDAVKAAGDAGFDNMQAAYQNAANLLDAHGALYEPWKTQTVQETPAEPVAVV